MYILFKNKFVQQGKTGYYVNPNGVRKVARVKNWRMGEKDFSSSKEWYFGECDYIDPDPEFYVFPLTEEQAECIALISKNTLNDGEKRDMELGRKLLRYLDVEFEKNIAILHIDQTVGMLRRHTFTHIPGQTELYIEKLEEATDFLALDCPNDDIKSYPLIHAEVKATGKSPDKIAIGILEAKRRCIQAEAKLEEIRLRAKFQINKAVSVGEVLSIKDSTLYELRNINVAQKS